MRISEQSPKGVNGLSTLLDDSEQLTPWPSSRCAAVTPRRTLASSPRPMRKRSVAGSTVQATPGLGHAVRECAQDAQGLRPRAW